MAELEGLPEGHPLKEVLSTSKLYRAILNDERDYPDFKGPETIFGVSSGYLFRFDFLPEWTRTTLNRGPRAERITGLAEELRETARELREELNPYPETLLHWVDARIDDFAAVGLSRVEALRHVAKELLEQWGRELASRMSDLQWSVQNELMESDQTEKAELLGRVERAIDSEFEKASALGFSAEEIREAIDSVLLKHQSTG